MNDLWVRPLHAILDNSAYNLACLCSNQVNFRPSQKKERERETYDTSQIWLTSSKHREDMLDHELLHATSDIWMPHHEGAKDSRHVQRAKHVGG